MKYWLLTTEYPPQFGGGIGTYCAQWAAILSAKGDEVTVFFPNKSVSETVERYVGGIRQVEFSPYLVNTSGFLGYETMISYSFAEIVKRYAEKEGVPDWVEAQEYNGIAYYLLQKKQLGYTLFKDLRVLVTCHAPSFLYFEFNHINNYKLPYFWIGEMEKFCIQSADVLISPSQYLVDRLQERHQFQGEFNVLPNPYGFEAKESRGTFTGDHFIFLAKLSPSKGILETLKAFKSLWQQGYTYKLKLIGDKNYYYHARQCLMGNFITNSYGVFIEQGLLELTGALPPAKVQEEIATAKGVLVPSTVDNFPYTVLECMAAEKVVLASRQGGHREIIEEGIDGFLFDHHQAGSFEQKIIQVFSLPEEQLKEVGRKARERVNQKCNPHLYYTRKLEILTNAKKATCPSNQFIFTREHLGPEVKESHALGESKKGLLSVVVPFYNMGDFVKETIASIKASDYPEMEIILLDDGSDDSSSLEVLIELDKDPQVKVITQKNRGLPEVRNVGAFQANGEFLAFLDADDTVHPTYYSKAIEVLKQKTNVHFVGCWVQYFENSTSIWPAFTPEPPYLLYHNMVNSSGLVYKRASFLAAGQNDSQFVYGMEDYDSVVSLVAAGFKGVVLPEVLFNYRVRKNSMARGFNHENKSYLYKILAEKHKTFYSNFAVENSNLLTANGPGYAIENPTLDFLSYAGGSTSDKILRKLFSLVKQQPLLRKIAIMGYSKVKSI